MTLEQALSMHTSALVLEADEPHYSKVFTQILTSLQGISDRVEGSDLGTAYVRLDGLEHLYGDEARLVNAVLNAVPRDLAPRVGVAEAKFPAFVAATVSQPSRATRVPSDAASFLASHPVNLLPVPPNLKIALHRFGLHTLGDVASMTEATLMDRFGPEGRRAWQLSQGIDDSPLMPMTHSETVVEHISLPFSSASLDLLLTVVDTLLTRAFAQPTMQGRYASKAVLECALEDGPTWSREFSFKGGVGNRVRALFGYQGQDGRRPPPGCGRGRNPDPGQPHRRVRRAVEVSSPMSESRAGGNWSKWREICGHAPGGGLLYTMSSRRFPDILLPKCGLYSPPSTLRNQRN